MAIKTFNFGKPIGLINGTPEAPMPASRPPAVPIAGRLEKAPNPYRTKVTRMGGGYWLPGLPGPDAGSGGPIAMPDNPLDPTPDPWGGWTGGEDNPLDPTSDPGFSGGPIYVHPTDPIEFYPDESPIKGTNIATSPGVRTKAEIRKELMEREEVVKRIKETIIWRNCEYAIGPKGRDLCCDDHRKAVIANAFYDLFKNFAFEEFEDIKKCMWSHLLGGEVNIGCEEGNWFLYESDEFSEWFRSDKSNPRSAVLPSGKLADPVALTLLLLKMCFGTARLLDALVMLYPDISEETLCDYLKISWALTHPDLSFSEYVNKLTSLSGEHAEYDFETGQLFRTDSKNTRIRLVGQWPKAVRCL